MDIPMDITEHTRERLDLQGRKDVVIAYDDVDHFNDDDKSTSSNASTVSTGSENKISSCDMDMDMDMDIDVVTEHFIEFEKDDLALFKKNGSKNNNNNNETDTDTCTTAMNTMMLDQSSFSSFDHDDEEPLLLFSSNDSEYDVFEEGEDDEDDDISIIIEEEGDDDDMMIIKVQELPSITSSMSSVIDDDDDDDTSCLSNMIDNRMEQFEFDLLELKGDDIFFQFDNTSSNTESTTSTTTSTISETVTPITTIVVTEEVDVIEFQDHHHWQQQQTSQHVALITVVLSLLLLFPMIGSSTVFIASDGIIQMKEVTRMTSTSTTDNTLFIPERIKSMNFEETVLPVPGLSRYGFYNKEETNDDDHDDVTVALYEVALTRSDTIDTVPKRRKKNKKSRLPLVVVPTKVVCRIVKQILTNLISRKWTTESPTELMIDVRPSQSTGGKHHKKNNLLQLLFRGQIHADAALSSGPIIFDAIRFSSIKLELEQVTVNLFSFLSSRKNHNRNKLQLQRRRLLLKFVNKYQRIIATIKKNRSNNNNNNNNKRDQQQISEKPKKKNIKKRFPNQFEIRIDELTMSSHDLLLSSSVRNGLRQLLIKVLQDRGIVHTSTIQITSIDILPTGKISCQGDAQTQYGSTKIPFEVRTGITVDETGDGRVLLFPGLEVSLMSMRDIGLFIPISFYTTLSLNVGHHTKFHTIVVDGKQKRIKIGASVTINNTSNNNNNDSTLPHSISTTTVTSTAATTYSSAKFFYDMGRGLTKLGNFSN